MKIIKKIFKYLGFFILALITYLVVVVLISFIPVNTMVVNEEKPIDIYLLTNGVHTDIVVPATNEIKNWKTLVLTNNTTSKDSTANYLAMGWGDKGFYLETPTWADLKASTALKAAAGVSTSALHTTYYKNMKLGADCKKISISVANYKLLVDYINNSFDFKNNALQFINTKMVYSKTDAFYEAKGSYSLFYTCNSWANGALKAANQKAALHTLTDTGIFRHYE